MVQFVFAFWMAIFISQTNWPMGGTANRCNSINNDWISSHRLLMFFVIFNWQVTTCWIKIVLSWEDHSSCSQSLLASLYRWPCIYYISSRTKKIVNEKKQGIKSLLFVFPLIKTMKYTFWLQLLIALIAFHSNIKRKKTQRGLIRWATEVKKKKSHFNLPSRSN